MARRYYKPAELKGDALLDRKRSQVTGLRDRQGSFKAAKRSARSIQQIADENRRLNILAEQLHDDIARLAAWRHSVH
jgi:hypothetical protein